MAEYEADFNVNEDASEEPLVPDGNYNGSITKAAFYEEGNNLKFYITLADNGGECTDGETPVDGATIPYTIWFPKAGDKDEKTASGRQTKFQWKVNNIKKVAEALGISMNTPAEIMESLANSEWIGIEVTCKVGTNEYLGNITNQIDNAAVVE